MLSYAFDPNKGETPQSIAKRRQLAQAMAMQIGTPRDVGEGLTAVGKAIAARRMMNQANKAQQAGTESANTAFNSILGAFGGGGGQTATTSQPAATTAAYTPNQGGFDVRGGLIDRGLPEHVADAFVMNFQDESGLNPSINEIEPLVPGSRGGFGLAQWTGPRRNALEAFAANRGANVADPNMQLDFLMTELQGPENAAMQAIMAAPDKGSAAAAIVNKFLRPAEKHRASREARYMQGSGGVAPRQMAQAMTQPQQQGASVQDLMKVASNPFLTPIQQQMVGTLLQDRLKRPDPMEAIELERAQLELDALRNPQVDPMDALRQEKLQLEIDSMRNPEGTTQEQNYEAYARREVEAGREPMGWIEYHQAMKGGGLKLGVDSEGNVTFQQGGAASGSGSGDLTEAQSKSVIYATRAQGALGILDAIDTELASPRSALGAGVPVVGNYLKSEDYQRAEQAGTEFLQAILRKDTGAAITEAETNEYGKVYLPQPGDSQGVIEQKRVSRARALEALQGGMGPEEMLAKEKALLATQAGSAVGGQAGGLKDPSEMTDDEIRRELNGG